MLVVRAVRSFATARSKAAAKDKPFLSDAIAKAAIGKDAEVAASFVSAFAAVVHGKRVRVTGVTPLSDTTGLSLVRDMKHDIALRYSIGGAETAVLEVVPQHYNRALVEIQQQPETYLPGRALAHASGHYLAAINEEAKAVKAEKRKEEEAKAVKAKLKEEEAKRAARDPGAAGQPRSKTRSREPKSVFENAVYTAYVRVEPVHLLMLSDFCYAHDTAANVWRAPKSSSALAGGKYGWASPLLSTYRLTTAAESAGLVAGLDNPGLNTFASSLQKRLSITIVHLPLVPLVLDDKDAWSKFATLPEHAEALESYELRQWLHYLAHTSLKDGKVEMPAELRTVPIFRKSAEMAETLLLTSAFSYSEKEMADSLIQVERERQEELAAAAEALTKERAAAAETLAMERAAAAETLTMERAAAAETLKMERAAAAVERAAAAKREAALTAQLERLEPGSGAS